MATKCNFDRLPFGEQSKSKKAGVCKNLLLHLKRHRSIKMETISMRTEIGITYEPAPKSTKCIEKPVRLWIMFEQSDFVCDDARPFPKRLDSTPDSTHNIKSPFQREGDLHQKLGNHLNSNSHFTVYVVSLHLSDDTTNRPI